MALRTGCITVPSRPGLRISVMSRHTRSDGKTPDPEISEASLDLWLKRLAPPAKLIGDYYKRGISWEEFEQRFTTHLNSWAAYLQLQDLVELARRQDVTILCVEPTPERCHRRLIAEACRRLDPKLAIIIE